MLTVNGSRHDTSPAVLLVCYSFLQRVVKETKTPTCWHTTVERTNDHPQGYMDHVTHNMDVYYKRVAADAKTWQARDYLAGEIGLLKYQTTRTAHLFSDNGCQLFGGRAVTRTGMGKYMERLNRCYKIYSIYGGSEEIMADLGVRQGLREWSKADRVVAKL